MNPILGIIFHAIGGFAAGSFYAPCKRVKGWAWETFWLVHGVFAWIAAPLLIAFIVMPNFFSVLAAVSFKVIFWSYFFGVLWGIGGLTFGLTMRYLGMSLGMSVALGFCATFGTLIPPVYEQFFGDPDSGNTTITELLTTTPGRITLIGIGVCLLGIIICGKAGMMKERDLSAQQKAESIKEFNFSRGMIVATVSGILSACMAFAFAAGSPIQEMAIEMGIRPILSNVPLLVVVLLGGFTTNCLWCLALSFKNKTYTDYSTAPKGHLSLNYMLCMIAGVVWYLQFFFYGMGSSQMGKYSFASWTLHMAFIIITSNMVGLLTKEWKGSDKKTINCILTGILILILSTVIIGFANKLGAPLRIMPLGDSITAGYTDNPKWDHSFEFGYRSGLYRRLDNAGVEFIFAGQSEEPFNNMYGDPTHGGTVSPSFELREVAQDGHRGYGGWSINAIQKNVAGWIEQDRPDIILLLIGINGINAGSSKQLDVLVKTIFEADEKVKLVVAQITPLSKFNQDLFDYNRYISKTLVPVYMEQGYSISTVDLYKHFLINPNDPKSIDPERLSNNINHPTNAIYDKMSQSWFEGIMMLIKK